MDQLRGVRENQFDMKSMLQTLVAVILLGGSAYLIHPYFQELSFYQMKDVKIQVIEAETALKIRLLFAVAFGFVPLLFFALNKMLKLTETKQKIFCIAAILITGIIFWQFKINSLNLRYEELMQVKIIQYYFALEDLHLELYLLLGFIIGAILGGIGLYRSRKRN